MNPSALVLIFTVLVVFGLWIKALITVSLLEFGSDSRRQNKFVISGALGFVFLVAVNVAAGMSGAISRFDHFPPPIAVFFIFNVILVPSFVTWSSFGRLLARHLSVKALVGFHSFRILAEILILLAVHEGVAPFQMSAEGYNPDLVTGIAAFWIGVLGVGAKRKAVTFVFNLWGLVALGIIAFIAITSMPVPQRLFMNEPSNIWVTTAPYTLLPGILVSAAVTAHLIYFKQSRSF